MKQINDPVFGELEYDGVKKGWTKKIPLGIWGAVDYQLDLILKCDEDEEITEEQRDGYKSYLKNLPNFAQDVRETIFLFYKEHYEDFYRKFRLPDKLNIDVADEKTTIRFLSPWSLFIDRNGNFGWLSSYISDRYLISVILSDGKPKIFKGWNVLKLDYGRVDDDVFGEMYFDQGWCKWIKTDINGIDGQWVELSVEAMFSDDEITPKQKANYQKYLQNEKRFLEEYPKALFEYYKKNYRAITKIWDDADLFNPKNMDEKSVKDLVQLQRLYFEDGERYGWLCECDWDEENGLAIYYDNDYDGICIGSIDSLVI